MIRQILYAVLRAVAVVSGAVCWWAEARAAGLWREIQRRATL